MLFQTHSWTQEQAKTDYSILHKPFLILYRQDNSYLFTSFK
nr:MAG TPA: hypothetical protein [Caudoviricetes sp.]